MESVKELEDQFVAGELENFVIIKLGKVNRWC